MIIVDIVTQHAEEAAFLWLLRSQAVHEPHYSLDDLARLDGRVEAHIAGIQVAGTEGWKICVAELGSGEPGEIFAAGVVALENSEPRRVDLVIEAGIETLETSRGLISAIGWLPYQRVMKLIRRLLEADSPLARRAGIGAAAIHRRGIGPVLSESLIDADTRLRTRALRAVGELGTIGMLHALTKRLTDEDADCRFWAAWSLTLLGDAKAVRILKAIVEKPGTHCERAAKIVLRRLDPSTAKAWQRDLARDADLKRLAVIAAGVIGDPAAIPWLIEQMETAELARVSGEAFTMITGTELAPQHLEGGRPEGFESGPTENPTDPNVALDPDENLPWPARALLEKWWGVHRGEFTAGTRYLLGKPISSESLQRILRDGRQRQREAAALELAVANPGEPLFEVRSPGVRQQRLLGAVR